MMKKRQYQHMEKFQGAAISLADAIKTQYTPVKFRPHVYVSEEPGEFYAQEAAGCHQEGGESHQVLARGF
jgi:hypothetical protein